MTAQMTRLPQRPPAVRGRRPEPTRARRLVTTGVWAVLAAGLLMGLGGDHVGQDEIARFQSRPDLRPPLLTVDTVKGPPERGYTFLAPWRGDGQSGPMIVDGRGRMVWFHPLPAGEEAENFRVQRFHGQPVLTWWEGFVDEDGYGHGEYVIANRHYHEIARFRPGDGRLGDFHEFVVTPRGTALVTAYRPLPHHDLSSVGGPEDGTVLNSVVEEIDIDTGRVLMHWSALDHVALTASNDDLPDDQDDGLDFFHVNSIDVDHDGNLLISSRHTDAIYKVDRDTGRVIWRLGGRHSDFTFGPGARFHAQHDVRRQPDGDITLFDNSNPPQKRDHSRLVRLHVDPTTRKVTLAWSVEHPLGLSSDSQGSAQTLPDGDVLSAWGSEPFITRFSENGDVRFDAHFPLKTDEYRAWQAPWSGRPRGRPAISAEKVDDQLSAYASWNGATEVARWQLLAGNRRDHLRPVASSPRAGFETVLTTTAEHHRYVAARALSSDGVPLGTSPTVRATR